MSVTTNLKASTMQALNAGMFDNPEQHSVHEYFEHVGGEELLREEHVFDGDGAQSDNLFVLTGSIKLLELSMEIVQVVDSTDFASVKFDLFPTGGAAVDITGTVDGSGCLVGDIFIKNAAKGTALTYIDTALAVVTESAANKNFFPTILTKKTGAVTNIRLTFNGDGSTAIQARICARWHPISADGSLALA